MCAHSLLKPLIIKLLIAKLHFRSSIEEYLILVSINRLEKVDRPIHTEIANQSIDRQKLLIACIDDSVSVCKNLELFLNQQGYRSYGVQDPLKIMTTLIKHKPDLIFLDLLMPMANGYEICQQIRRIPSLQDVPVVILTEKDGLFDRMRAKAIGATELLSKPIAHADILRVLGKYLESSG
jgi:two-component system, chemotaxis family, response regulator PixG